MKKVFVLLFPQIEYVGKEWSEQELFNQCIKERYLQNGYDFVVASYKSPKNEMQLPVPHKVVEADITFEQSSPYFIEDWQTPDFETLAEKLNAKGYQQIVVGGFHCFDCVKKFATEIYRLNNNIIVDTDLTELFFGARHGKAWQANLFDPDLKLNRAMERDLGLELLKRVRKNYSDPIWGISKEMFDKIDAKIAIVGQEEGIEK